MAWVLVTGLKFGKERLGVREKLAGLVRRQWRPVSRNRDAVARCDHGDLGDTGLHADLG